MMTSQKCPHENGAPDRSPVPKRPATNRQASRQPSLTRTIQDDDIIPILKSLPVPAKFTHYFALGGSRPTMMASDQLEWTTGGDPNLIARKKLGIGGYGCVYEVYDILQGGAFARKLMNLELSRTSQEDLHNETRAIRKLCQPSVHRNIIEVLRFGQLAGSPYYFIDMELCDLTLWEYIYKDSRDVTPCFIKNISSSLKEHQIWKVMREILSGMEFIHGQKEIHRDLKPQNSKFYLIYPADKSVLYSRKDSTWKISDFGFTSEGSSNQHQFTKTSRGTSGYRAPELIDGGLFNNKVDIWAMGCILFELAEGKKAFRDDLIIFDHCRSGNGLKLILEDQMLDHDARSAISETVNSMIQRDAALRPSATALLMKACQHCRPPVREDLTIFHSEEKKPSVSALLLIDHLNSEDSHESSKAFKSVEYINVNTSNAHIATVAKNEKGIRLMEIRESLILHVLWSRECQAGCGGVLRPCFSPDSRYAQFHDGQSVIILKVDEIQVQQLEEIQLPPSKDVFGYKAIAVAPSAHSLAVLDSHTSDKSIRMSANQDPKSSSNERKIHVLTPPREICLPCLQYALDGNRVFLIHLPMDGQQNAASIELLIFDIHSTEWTRRSFIGINNVTSYVPLMGYMKFEGNDYMSIEIVRKDERHVWLISQNGEAADLIDTSVGFRAVIGSQGRVICVRYNGDLMHVMTVKSRIRRSDGSEDIESLGWIKDMDQMDFAENELKTFHKRRLTYLRKRVLEFVSVDITSSVG